MLKRVFVSLLVAVIVILSCGLAQGSTVTVATFADPAANWSTPLFIVDLENDVIKGGWLDSQTGLDLVIFGNSFKNAFFKMDPVSYTGGLTGGETGNGIIQFFADGQDPGTTPLVQIVFNKAYLTPSGFGVTAPFFVADVAITGSEIGGSLTDESFMFGFTNHRPLAGDWNNGYTATASFTSSAVPEPATLVLLGTAGIWSFTRKRRSA
jgi:hypothetical protein